jgi:phosphotransferase system enzyme I (PtsP)
MVSTPAGGRVLLRRLREAMAEPQSPQSRLDKIVRIIAANMVAEVCSVYLLRAGDWLELFATEGLNPKAVHNSRLKVGQGLIGDIAAHARPLNLSDAPEHPNFVYLPETGEEAFHSFLGVPVLRAARVIGVLAVQNQTRRHYTEEEVENLQTVAMVMAEMVAHGGMVDPAEWDEAATKRSASMRLKGLRMAEGIAMGQAVLHEPRVEITRMIADNAEEERARLARAIEALRQSIDLMLADGDLAAHGEHREVLEAYRMFAHDAGWLTKLEDAVDSGLTAEAAVERVQLDLSARLSRSTDSYLRERIQDLDDLAHRLLRHLAGKADTAAKEGLPDDAIIIARTMGPAELLDYDRTKLKGVVLEEGSPTSHVAIVARALEIPLVGKVEGLVDRVDLDTRLIVDGEQGEIFLNPGIEIIRAYDEKRALRAQRQVAFAAIRDEPAITHDGVEIKLNINAGLLVDLPHLAETGANGIGLFRTELQFMVGSAFPRLGDQTELYKAVLDAAGDRPVVFRTLDIGGDKALPYLDIEPEENPALGWRAIRIALDRPALLRYQTRALLQAAGERSLSIMFPMISDVSEFMAAKAVLEKEVERLRQLNRPVPGNLRVGTMLEVPSLAFQLPALLPLVDFVSVGSNDLMQFFFAADRGNPRLADRYDFLSPSALSLLRHICRSCDAAGVPLTLCGEMAGRPLEAMALVGLGFRSLSMTPASIGPVKVMIRSLDRSALARVLDTMTDLPDHSVRAALTEFANSQNISI